MTEKCEQQNLEGHICDTDVTINEIEHDLQSHLQTTNTIESFIATEIGAGKGFLSCTAKVELHWKAEDEHLPKSVIVKIPSMKALTAMMEHDSSMKMMFESITDNLKKLHLCEVTFYSLHGQSFVIPTVRSFGQHGIGEDHHAYIIQEDLTETATQMAFGSGYSLAQVKDIVAHIGRMQAWSMKNDWKNENMCLNMKDFMNESQISQMLDSMTDFHKYLDGNEELKAKLSDQVFQKFKLIRGRKEMIDVIDTLHSTLGLPSVMVHGDMWCNNILMTRNDDGGIGDTVNAFIDWQIIHEGSPGEDIARLLTSSVSSSMRMDKQEEILRHYYDTLCGAMDNKAPFEFDLFIGVYERTMLMFCCFFLPLFQRMMAIMSSGQFLPPGTDPIPIIAKFMDDLAGMIVTAVELNDKYPDVMLG